MWIFKRETTFSWHLHNPRLFLVLAAVLQFSHVITGFRNRDLRGYIQRRFGLSPDDYTAAQLRYDLLKLRAKNWIKKLERKTTYVLTPQGMAHATALVKLNECLNGILGMPPPSTDKNVGSPQPEVAKGFRRVRKAIEQMMDSIGLSP
jgi:hypothetical protein